MMPMLYWTRVAVLAAATLGGGMAQAGMFDDEEARRAIIELRQRVDVNRQTSDAALRRLADAQAESLRRGSEDMIQMRRSLLELQNQIEGLRADMARMTGQYEQAIRHVAEVQRGQRDLAAAQKDLAAMQKDLDVVQKDLVVVQKDLVVGQQNLVVEQQNLAVGQQNLVVGQQNLAAGQQDLARGVSERVRQLEPVKVMVDGREIQVEPAEQRAFDNALASFRAGDFVGAQSGFLGLISRFPRSGYLPSALFWLGNAQYATRDYKEAISNFRILLSAEPNHPRAPEAMLSIANCQIELKDVRAARKTLEDLGKMHPRSEAAMAGKDRLARLR